MFRIVLTYYHNQILYSYQEDNRCIELKLFKTDNVSLGTVYLSRVNNICDNIDASFVEYQKGCSGFLKRSDLKAGTLIPVQIIREGTKLKEPLVNTDITLSGMYCVLHEKGHGLKVSQKLDTDLRKQLIKDYSQITKHIKYGIVLRTNAGNADKEVVLKEIEYLAHNLDEINQKADTRTLYSKLYEPDEEWFKSILDTNMSMLDEIVTDNPIVFNKLSDKLPRLIDKGIMPVLRLYDDKLLPLIKLYSLETRLKEATNKKVWLKSGGFLIIEKTEALTAIDVNSGKTTFKTDKENSVFKLNMEAADEIAAQLRLRNLSGIILVDFINMNDASHDATLLSHLRDIVKLDPIKTQVHGMTSLGLVEMTRMKGRNTLYEQTGSFSDDAVISANKGRI